MPRTKKQAKRDDPASKLNPTDPGRPTFSDPSNPSGSGGRKGGQGGGTPPSQIIDKAVKRELAVLGAPISPSGEMRVTKPELEALVTAILKKAIKGEARAQSFLPPEIKAVVACMVMPCGGNKTRIPDGKARATGLCASYNVFPVVGNFADATDDADKGRFCWSFTPTPLNFDWTRYNKSFSPITYASPGGAENANFTLASWSQSAFAAEVDPERAWDPETNFIVDPAAFYAGKKSKVPQLEQKRIDKYEKHSPGLGDYIKDNPKLRGHKPADVERHRASRAIVEECRAALADTKSKWTGPEKDKLAAKYAKHAKNLATIEASVYTPSGWNLYSDNEATFVSGTGYTDDGLVNSIDSTYEFTDGQACTYRPVAMSVWFENTATDYADGGSVAISYLPSEEVLGNIIPQDPGGDGSQAWFRKGPLTNWEKHAGLPLQSSGEPKSPATTYMGKFKNGAYCWWLPDDASDYKFRTPVDNAVTPFPIIVVAGQVSGNNGTPDIDPGVVAQIKVQTVYEYTTDEAAIDTTSCHNYPGAMESIAMVMRRFPQAMSNDNHQAWWKVMLKTIGSGIGGFLVGGPAGAAAAVGGYLTSLA